MTGKQVQNLKSKRRLCYEKRLSFTSFILSSALLLSMAAPMTVFAVKTEDEILKKDVTAYLYSNDKTDKLNCLFKSSMPDMPYISTVDFCSNVFKDTASEIKNDDGTYTVTLNNAAMVIDTENDTVYFDEFESFMGGVPVSEGTFLDSPYCKNEESVIERKPKSITLDLGEYDIDILDSDGRSYFPVSTLSLLFVNTYNAAEYLGDSIYFIHSSDIIER